MTTSVSFAERRVIKMNQEYKEKKENNQDYTQMTTDELRTELKRKYGDHWSTTGTKPGCPLTKEYFRRVAKASK